MKETIPQEIADEIVNRKQTYPNSPLRYTWDDIRFTWNKSKLFAQQEFYLKKQPKYCIKLTKMALDKQKQDILNLIDKERDNGNLVGGGFSPALCLSKVIKFLEKK